MGVYMQELYYSRKINIPNLMCGKQKKLIWLQKTVAKLKDLCAMGMYNF